MKPQNTYQSITLLIAAIAAFSAIPSIWPYGFYQIIRWVVCFCISYNAYQYGMRSKYFLASSFAIIAIIFNPIAPIHFKKDLWQIIDCVTGIIAVVAYLNSKKGSQVI